MNILRVVAIVLAVLAILISAVGFFNVPSPKAEIILLAVGLICVAAS